MIGRRRERWRAGALGLAACVAGSLLRSTLATAEPESSNEAGSGSGATSGATDPEGPEPIVVSREALEGDGRDVSGGVRIERNGTGRWRIAREAFPAGGEPRGLELPESLGGGFLFHQAQVVGGEARTAFYRGAEWSGALLPVGSLSFVVEKVRAGFDRLYLGGRGDWLGFDLEARRITSLEPLPPLPAIDGMAFSASGSGVVQAPLVGTWWTSDAGLSWQRLSGVRGVEQDEGIVLLTADGRERVRADGTRVVEEDDRRRVMLQRSARKVRFAEAELIERMLTTGVRRGSSVHAWLDGEWLELRYGDELELIRRPAPVVAGECVGLGHESVGGARATAPTEAPIWFLCRGADTRVLRVGPRGVEEMARLLGARRLLAGGAGSLVVEGDCQPTSTAASTSTAAPTSTPQGPVAGAASCWLHAASSTSGASSPVSSGAQGPLRRASLRRPAGALAVVVDAEHVRWLVRQAGGLALTDDTGTRRLREFALPDEGELRRLVLEGTWLPELHAVGGELGAWLVRGEEFVGLTLGSGGLLISGPIQRSARRALFAGRHGLVWGAAGFAKETLDGGITWSELALPFRSGEPDFNVPRGQAQITMGCTAAGCVIGRMLRVGWGARQEPSAHVLPTPERLPIPPSGAGRFRFSCGTSGAPRGRVEAGGFFGHRSELEPPAGRASTLRNDVLFGVEAVDGGGRLWASGPRDGSWAREGRAQLSFRDPFSREIRSSRVTRGLFADALRAEEGLGRLEPSGALATVTLDAEGRGGFLLVASRAKAELFTFAEGEPLARVTGATELGLRRLHGAVRSGGVWYTGQRSQDGFTVLRVQGGRLVEHVTLPLGAGSLGSVEVVSGPELGLALAVEGETGTFVYGLSESGELGDPAILGPSGARPRTCQGSEPGYRLVRELPISPLIDSAGRVLDLGRVSARYRVGPGWACLEALAARTRGLGESGAASAERVKPGASQAGLSLPLIVTDLSGDGRIDALVCR